MYLNDEFPMTIEREAGMNENVPAVSVGFGFYPVKDGRASTEAGHDVYKDVEFVRIAIPGDKNSLFFQPAQESHKKRFPKAYDAFKARGHEVREGMPVEQWAPISRSVALNLKVMHIHTVEALAEVHEGMIDKLGSSGRELREKAKAWLREAKDGAETNRLAKEKMALEDQLKSMQAQIAALQQDGKGDDTAAAAARKPRKQAAAA